MQEKILQVVIRKVISIGFVFIICCNTAKASDTLELQPIRVLDTIRDINVINVIPSKDFIKGGNSFITTSLSAISGLFLIEKVKDFWVVYDLNDFVSNFNVSQNFRIDSDFVRLDVAAMRSGNLENRYGWVVLIDHVKKRYLVLQSSADLYENSISVSKCNSKISFGNGVLSVNKECGDNADCSFCENSGRYILHGIFFVKEKK